MAYAVALMKRTGLGLVLFSLLGIALMSALPAHAAVEFNSNGTDPDELFGVNAFDEALQLSDQDLSSTTANIINVALSLLGIVAVVIILWGGFKWMTAGGSDEQVGEARKIIFAGVIGLVIILSAWTIARFVIESASQATGSGNVETLD